MTKKKQRKRESILGVNTNSNINITVLTEHLSYVSSIWGLYKST